MSLEPGDLDVDGGAQVDFSRYRACPICQAPAARPCTSMYARVFNGRPDGPPRALQVAHGHRKQRAHGSIARE